MGFLIAAKQWLNDLFLLLPGQVLGIITIGQARVGSMLLLLSGISSGHGAGGLFPSGAAL